MDADITTNLITWAANHFLTADSALIVLLANMLFKYLPFHGANDLFEVVLKIVLKGIIALCQALLGLLERIDRQPQKVVPMPSDIDVTPPEARPETTGPAVPASVKISYPQQQTIDVDHGAP